MDPIAIMDNAISNVRTTLEFHKAGYEQLHRAFASRITRFPEYSPDAMAQEVRGLEKAKTQVERDQMLLENLTAIKAKMVEAMQQENGEGNDNG